MYQKGAAVSLPDEARRALLYLLKLLHKSARARSERVSHCIAHRHQQGGAAALHSAHNYDCFRPNYDDFHAHTPVGRRDSGTRPAASSRLSACLRIGNKPACSPSFLPCLPACRLPASQATRPPVACPSLPCFLKRHELLRLCTYD